MPVSDSLKAVFLMRYADLECERGNLKSATLCVVSLIC
jgi:hypothetical protein